MSLSEPTEEVSNGLLVEVCYQSIARSGKPRNGDCANVFEDDCVFIGAVADGVSGNPCDWKASTQMCADLVYYYNEEFRGMGVEAGIAHSLRKSYARLYYEKGRCAGMLTTLSSVIVDKAENCYYHVNVGDSRILRFSSDRTPLQVSEESEFRIPVDVLLNCVIPGGPIDDVGSFALMTDGFWANRSGFERELALVLDGAELDGKLDELMQLNRVTQSDDMTLMLIRFDSPDRTTS